MALSSHPQPVRKQSRGCVMDWLLTRLPLVLLLILLPVLVTSVAYAVWYVTRTQPEPLARHELFPGIWYTREIRQIPVAQVIHIVEIDLETPGLHFRVTPADDRTDYTYSARTASQFLMEQGLTLAINGDYFDPSYDKYILDYYPHQGEGVNIHGYTVSEGQEVSKGYAPSYNTYRSLYITADNEASFAPIENPYNVISGNIDIVNEGRILPRLYTLPAYLERQPRTAVALTQDHRSLIIVVVDGRQPNYSDGASMIELAAMVIAQGGYTALNLDGGGSSTLVIKDEHGHPHLLNSPIHNRIPGRERPVANHLGVWYENMNISDLNEP
jgi:hypothetical protein